LPIWFQSSPDPKVGCNTCQGIQKQHTRSFNPHPTRRSGATPLVEVTQMNAPEFQSSPDPKVGCNKRMILDPLVDGAVSILTRPEGRVQRPHPRGIFPKLLVSILTRPEGRVQPGAALDWAIGKLFQSSPDPKVGCNAADAARRSTGEGFNPHPTRRS